MSPRAVEDPWIGRTVGGEYRIRSLLGSGGFGAVYLADQQRVGRTVVVKVIRRALTDEPGVVARFQREAQVVAALDHPNIVKVFTAGETEDGAHFVVMEYVEGPTLSDEILRCGRIQEGRAIEIGAQIASALAAAHAAGVIHRDLKPANVVLTRLPGGEDHARVLDFGIAKLAEPGEGTALTGSDVIVGTPAYMSPEQASGGGVDGRSDLYTLGVMLYEMVTGKHPYDADTPVQYILQHLQARFTPPELRAPGVRLSEGFLRLLDRACEKAPDRRFESAQAMRAALRAAQAGRWESGSPLTMPTPVPAWTSPSAASCATEQAVSVQPSALRLLWPLVVLGLLFAGAIGGVVMYILTDAGAEKPVPAATSEAVEVPERPQSVTERAAAPPSPVAPPPVTPSRKPTRDVARPGTAPAPPVAPTRPPAPAPDRLPPPQEPTEFFSVVDDMTGFRIPGRARFHLRTASLISMDTPWHLDEVADFLVGEYGGASRVMINDNRDEAEPWFGVIMQGGPLRMVRVDPEGTGTRLNYFVNTD